MNILFHLKNYFDLSFRMNRMPYIALVLAHALIITPFVMGLMAPDADQTASGVYRDSPMLHIMHLLYNLILVPAHIKRMKDIGISLGKIEAVLYIFYLPTVLVIVLSDGAFNLLLPLLQMVGFAELALSIYLIVVEGEKGKNLYGQDPKE